MSKWQKDLGEDDGDDDDYMSDKILADAAKAAAPQLLNPRRRVPPPPPPPPVASEKSRKIIEVEQREQGLSTAISSENIGFQLLKKMGFKEGSTLGAHPSKGLSEPIPIRLHPARSGLGEESEKKEKIRQKEEVKRKFNHRIQSTYQDRIREKYYIRRLRSDIRKCQIACERLDRERMNLLENPLWKSDDEKLDRTGVGNDNDDDDDGDEQEDEPVDNRLKMETQLGKLTIYLREKHFYCHWCGQTFDKFDELEESCPGNERDLH